MENMGELTDSLLLLLLSLFFFVRS